MTTSVSDTEGQQGPQVDYPLGRLRWRFDPNQSGFQLSASMAAAGGSLFELQTAESSNEFNP